MLPAIALWTVWVAWTSPACRDQIIIVRDGFMMFHFIRLRAQRGCVDGDGWLLFTLMSSLESCSWPGREGLDIA